MGAQSYTAEIVKRVHQSLNYDIRKVENLPGAGSGAFVSLCLPASEVVQDVVGMDEHEEPALICIACESESESELQPSCVDVPPSTCGAMASSSWQGARAVRGPPPPPRLRRRRSRRAAFLRCRPRAAASARSPPSQEAWRVGGATVLSLRHRPQFEV